MTYSKENATEAIQQLKNIRFTGYHFTEQEAETLLETIEDLKSRLETRIVKADRKKIFDFTGLTNYEMQVMLVELINRVRKHDL